MRIGGIRKRFTVQRMSTTQDSFGQQVRTWSDVFDFMGLITPVTGRNYYAASGERADVTHEIRTWYSGSIQPNDRIVNGTRKFVLKSPPINVDERNREWLLMCIEVLGTDDE